MSGLCVEALEGPSAFAALRQDWDGLIANGVGTVFSRWEWLFSWWSQLACGSTPLLLAARDAGGSLRGLLPLVEQRPMPLGLRRWSLLGDRWVGSDGLGPILARGFEEEAREALAEAVVRRSSRWQLLRLAGLPAGDPWVGVLRRRLQRQAAGSRLVAGDVCPVIRLAGDPFAGNPRRETYERRLRWLQRQPSFRIEVARDGAELDDGLTAFLALHDRRWRGDSDAVPGSAVTRFHREAAQLLAARGLCRVYLLWLHGHPIAAVYAFVDRRVFYYYLPAFDPAWAHRSVGTVLLGTLVEAARAEGCERFELLRGEEAYKHDWADARWRTVILEAAGPSLPARALERLERWQRGTRALSGRVLPVEAVWLWRRTLSRLSLRTSDLG